MKKRSLKALIVRILFVLRYAWRIPEFEIEKMDIKAEADTALTTEENLEELIKAYPHIIKPYLPRDYELEEMKARDAQSEYLYKLAEDCEHGIKEAIDEMQEITFGEFRDLLDFLVEVGEITDAKRREMLGEKVTEEEKEVTLEDVEELPEMLRGYVELMQLNVLELVEKKDLPEYRGKIAWSILTRDEETGRSHWIAYPYPTYRKGYGLVTITNKIGKNISVLSMEDIVSEEERSRSAPTEVRMEEEYMKFIPPEPSGKAKVRIEGGEGVIDWKQLQTQLTGMKNIQKRIERYLKERKVQQVYTYLDSLVDVAFPILDEQLSEPDKEYYDLVMHPEEKTQILSDEDKERLWKEFAGCLREVKIDPELYKEDFERTISVYQPFDINLYNVHERAITGIPTERALKIKKMPDKFARFSWRYVEWGNSALASYFYELQTAIKSKDVVMAIGATKKIKDTVSKLMGLVELNKDVVKR